MGFQKIVGSEIRQFNQQIIINDTECQKAIIKMQSVERFLGDFGFLSFGRDYILCDNKAISLQMISTSFELTAGSIIACCESGCIADAFSLLRKYRDDMFFYLYIVVYDTRKKSGCETNATKKMERNIKRWLNNDLKNLIISDVLTDIGQSPWVEDAVKKYKLKSCFKDLGNKLNDYVHSNGISFYNQNINAYQEEDLHNQMNAVLKDLRFITVSFLFLLTLCSPLSIMSTDYIDYLDCGMMPPNGSQYWVAPFVADFFKSNMDLIDENCMDYLRDNSAMKFE